MVIIILRMLWRMLVRPAYLVDGITEQKFIQSICAGSPVRVTNLNGNSVSAAAIAKRVSSIVRLWKGRHYPIVVLVDLEKRDCSSDVFAREILDAIRQEGIADQMLVSVVDRMIENWMIADPELWEGQVLKESVDGFSGATELKRMMPGYDKAADGPDLLRRSRASEISKRSVAFEAMRRGLGDIPCEWLKR